MSSDSNNYMLRGFKDAKHFVCDIWHDTDMTIDYMQYAY